MQKSSNLLFLSLFIFLIFCFVTYLFLMKYLEETYQKSQQIAFYEVQKQSSNILTKMLYFYQNQRNNLEKKYYTVLNYLEKSEIKDINLSHIYEEINAGLEDKPYNIYISDDNLIIKNTTYMPDFNFDLNFAKNVFEEARKQNKINISPPYFESFSSKFTSYAEAYLPNTNKVLQVSYTYNELNEDIKTFQNILNKNTDIKSFTAFIFYSNGFIGDFIFKKFAPYKETKELIESRLKKANEIIKNLNLSYNNVLTNKYSTKYYIIEKSPIFDETKILFTLSFDTEKYQDIVIKLRISMILVSILGIVTLYIINILRKKEKIFTYKDKFIAHSIHEIKTPLSIISINTQLREKTYGSDKFTEKIEGALRNLTNSYEDMVFLHTKDRINYHIEEISLEEVLKERIKYFETIAKIQSREIKLTVYTNFKVKMSKIELVRLIDNNLSNAIKYSFLNTCIEVKLTAYKLEFISKSDPIKDIKNIFKRYARENEILGGHGLGLAIVKDICDKYGIKKEVASYENTNVFTYDFTELTQ